MKNGNSDEAKFILEQSIKNNTTSKKLHKLLDNKKYCHELLEEIFENFSNSNEAIEKNLDNILENEKQN